MISCASMPASRRTTRTLSKQPRSSRPKPPKTVDEYIACVPEPTHTALETLRAAIRSVMPSDAVETISYGIPAFKRKRVLVWYAAFSSHCSLFPTAAVIEQFRDELKGFPTARGTVQFPANRPIPIRLVKKLVRARVGDATDE